MVVRVAVAPAADDLAIGAEADRFGFAMPVGEEAGDLVIRPVTPP